jgi:hypothetical protein
VRAQNAQLFTFSPTEFFALSSPLDRTARMAGLLGIVPARSRRANGKLAVYRKFRAFNLQRVDVSAGIFDVNVGHKSL